MIKRLNIKISIILVSMTMFMFSQTEQNKFFVGGNGNLSFGSIFNTTSKGIEISIMPKVGYFVIKNLAVALNANIGYTNYNKGGAVASSFSLGPFARYYFRIKKQALIAELGYNYGQSKESSTYYVTNPNAIILIAGKTKFNQYSIGVGYCYFVKENVSIEALYQFQLMDETDENNFTYYGISRTLKTRNNITIGLLFYF